MIRQRRLLALVLVLALFVSGCGEQRVLERLGFIHTVGYDLNEDGKLRISYFIPKFSQKIQAERGEFLTTFAHSSKQAKMMLSKETNWDLVSGQLRDVLMSDSFASRGIWAHIDSMIRDPTISPRVKLSIVEGSAAHILEKTYRQHPSSGMYLDRMLEKEIDKQTIPRIALFELERDLFEEGIDPVMPVLKDAGENIQITGLGLFRGDRYVGKIGQADIPIFALLNDNTSKLDFDLTLGREHSGNHSHIMVGAARSKRKFQVRRQASGRFEVGISLKIKASILEYTGGLKISDDAERRQLERKIAEAVSEKAEALVSRMQRKQADPLGIGMYVRNSMSYREWKQLDWREELPVAKVTCRVKFSISNYGRFR